jgi:TonB family protein
MARDRDPSKKRVTSKLQQGERGDDEAGLRTPNLSLKGNGAEDRAGQAAEQEFVLKMPDIPRRDAVDLNREKGAGPGILNRRATEAIRGNSDRFDLQLGKERGQEGQTESTRGVENGEGKQIPTLSALMPNFGTLSRISGSPSMDHVEGVLEGDGTFLNTKEFKYATFFYRVQDSVYDHWVGAALREYRRRDPTGNIYGVQDRATLLSISLDRDGSLDDVRVEKGSGVDFLDLVAVEAFRKAQPFPNPPQGIVDDDGRIRFNFKFVVTVGSGSGLNLFRRY